MSIEMTVSEIAEVLGLSRQAINNRVKELPEEDTKKNDKGVTVVETVAVGHRGPRPALGRLPRLGHGRHVERGIEQICLFHGRVEVRQSRDVAMFDCQGAANEIGDAEA